MLKICDLSSNNSINQQYTAIDNTDGAIIKATEGATYVNTYKDTDAKRVLTTNKLLGFYHFARPEKNQPETEALHFVNNVKDYLGNCILALDWEGQSLKCSQSWARTWLDDVYKITGVRPLIYVSEAYVKRVGDRVQPGNYGLWVAKYSNKSPSISPWKFKVLWQYTSTPYDISKFYGDADTWHKYSERLNNGK